MGCNPEAAGEGFRQTLSGRRSRHRPSGYRRAEPMQIHGASRCPLSSPPSTVNPWVSATPDERRANRRNVLKRQRQVRRRRALVVSACAGVGPGAWVVGSCCSFSIRSLWPCRRVRARYLYRGRFPLRGLARGQSQLVCLVISITGGRPTSLPAPSSGNTFGHRSTAQVGLELGGTPSVMSVNPQPVDVSTSLLDNAARCAFPSVALQ